MIDSHTLVTIITPSFNQAQFLEQTIQSVLAQDYPLIEYLVMDGGSEDGSISILNKHANKLTYWESKPDRGQAHAINKGLDRARGELVGWLNSDDLLVPNCVSKVISTFMQNPEVDVVYGRLERINERGDNIPTPILPKDRVQFSKRMIIGECFVNQPGAFWRRSFVDKAGKLNENLHYALDYEYWIRLALSGAIFLRIPDVLAKFRVSKSSKTVNQTAKMGEEQLGVLENFYKDKNLAEKIGVSKHELEHSYLFTRALISMYIFYGYYKIRYWSKAFYWIRNAVSAYPLILLQKRWFYLAYARLHRTSLQ